MSNQFFITRAEMLEATVARAKLALKVSHNFTHVRKAGNSKYTFEGVMEGKLYSIKVTCESHHFTKPVESKDEDIVVHFRWLNTQEFTTVLLKKHERVD